MTQLTLQLPDRFVQQLALLATEQKKSIEQVAMERLTSALQTELVPGSPPAILQVVRSLPPLDPEAVDELERAIEEGHLPVVEKGIFDESENS